MATIKRQYRFTTAPEHLVLDTRLSDRAFRLWCRLDRFAGENETAYPTHTTLAVWLDTSVASIKRAQKELLDTGWLTINHRPGDRSEYVLMVVPKGDVERIISAEINRRKAALEPEIEKKRERKRESRKMDAAARRAMSSQVSAGGEVTGDPPLPKPEGGSPMHEPVVHGSTDGPVTDGLQKEEPPKEEPLSETSGTLRAPVDPDVLPGMPAKIKPERDLLSDEAWGIVDRFLDWWKANPNHGPILRGRDRTRSAVYGLVVSALRDGVDTRCATLALVETGKAMPTAREYEEAIGRLRSGERWFDSNGVRVQRGRNGGHSNRLAVNPDDADRIRAAF